ncbi:type II toxin-antitoxin system Phd/YefM family antitoxin [Paramicrobacterium agarici]|nr:type II toxin-antitoxin system Phd/YefM family antitoxin [Microbacterium agarici]
MSAREFNQSVAAAQRHAADGPVVVTRRGEPAFVLLHIDDYRRLTDATHQGSLSERLAPSDGADLNDVEFERDAESWRPVIEF